MTDSSEAIGRLPGPGADASPAADPKTISSTRLAAASMIGTALEWFEFTLYNAMAAMVFNQLFFPQFDPIAGTILSFSTYAVGYLSRPLGGIVFGRLGDKLGRRDVLMLTLVLMGGTTFCIGLLPTHAMLGVWSSVLLVMIRFIQGVALGGEWAGAVLLTAEQASVKHRGFQASWAQVGAMAGIFAGTATLSIVTTLVSDNSFMEWGWRLPFLASAFVVLFGLWLRKAVPESPEFEKLSKEGHTAQAPLTEVVTKHFRNLLIAGGCRIGSDVCFGFLTVFSLSYLTQAMGVSRSVAITAVMIGTVANGLSCLAFAALSDRIGRRPVYLLGAVCSSFWIVMLFSFFETRDPNQIILAIVVGLVLHAAMYGPQASFVAEQFSTRVRYSGCSLAYTLAGALGGGLAPLLFTTLYHRYPGTLAIELYFWGALCVTAIAVLAARETAGRPFRE